MLISLDYDGTYTADKFLWNNFITLAKNAGHEIICFTMRHPDETILDMPKDIKIVYTCRKAKKLFAEEAGYKVNIWIDDRPSWLYDDALPRD